MVSLKPTNEIMSLKGRRIKLYMVIFVVLFIVSCIVSSAEELQDNISKDTAQLQMETLGTELGEEGMQEVDDYLELQASLPDALKASPYSYIAFAATDKESQTAYMTAIDESDLEAGKKAKLKADLQDIWNRYPNGFVVTDNLVLQEVDRIMAERFIASENASAGENGDSASQCT
ncbi:hypothetical protein [Methanolobus chelungpuianus]|uniref:hypothetical protein n=1 Tax=Methanolobus chelungpuianus TaxID=502115 RepID=UPI00211457F9|nr:hypothetical protein [Methanolobus chelungpuianus]